MKYKKIVVTAFGGPEVLQVVEEELRQPDPGEVLVRVHAAGVARSDIARRKPNDLFGQIPPFGLGFDFAGRVEAVGAGVTSFTAGQMVTGLNENLDSYSEYVFVNPEWMTAIPETVDPAQAACLGLNYAVAFNCLQYVADVKPGGKMLVIGAAGGVGMALIELGKLAGFEVYGTAATSKVDRLHGAGAVPIDYQKENLEERIQDMEFDIIFDNVFDLYLDKVYKRLRAKGKYIQIGEYRHSLVNGKYVSGRVITLEEYEKMAAKIKNWEASHADGKKMISYRGSDFAGNDHLSVLAGYLAAGKITPLVHERIPLTEAARAHQILDSGIVTGKIVLTCN